MSARTHSAGRPGTLVQIRFHLDAVRDVMCSTNAKCHRALGVTLFVRTQWYLIGEIVEAQNCGGSYMSKVSGMRLAIFSPRSATGSPRVSTRSIWLKR